MTPASKIYPAFTLDVMLSRKEGQYYDVKSAQKKPSEMADIVSAYANAEGGTVVIGISDMSRKLSVEEIRQLEYEKGVAHYEEDICPYATMDDLDPELLDAYRHKIGATRQTNEQVLRARQFIVKRHGEDALTNAVCHCQWGLRGTSIGITIFCPPKDFFKKKFDLSKNSGTVGGQK